VLQEKKTTFRDMTTHSGPMTNRRREAELLSKQLCWPYPGRTFVSRPENSMARVGTVTRTGTAQQNTEYKLKVFHLEPRANKCMFRAKQIPHKKLLFL
jgi:hypothetical protein